MILSNSAKDDVFLQAATIQSTALQIRERCIRRPRSVASLRLPKLRTHPSLSSHDEPPKE